MNIICVAIDTLRADHLSCYGYKKKTSPFIDNYAKQGTLFENFYASGIPTHPSFTTFYTGEHPITHRIVSHNGKVNLDSNTPVFTEELQKSGYITCAVDSLWRGKPWFTRGYEFYIDSSVHHKNMQLVSCDTQNGQAIPWIKEHKNDKFFLFLHYMDPHTPYLPPDKYIKLFYQGDPTDPSNHSLDDFYQNCPYKDWLEKWNFQPLNKYTYGKKITDASFIESLYDAEIRYVDDGLKKLIEALDREGLKRNTLVIIFADHGESLTEHGIYFDHRGLYENDIHIPLIIVGPGVPKGQRIKELVGNQDLFPTILETAKVTVSQAIEGKSLWPLISGKKIILHDKLVTEENTAMCKWAISKAGYKLILARGEDFHGFPAKEFYDLTCDPEEKINLAEENRLLLNQYERELENWISQHLKKTGKMDPLKEQDISFDLNQFLQK